jgi:hypothetical protein
VTDRLPIVVIYENPLDYPGKFVARRQWASAGRVEVEPEPLIVGDSLTEVRGVIPDGMVCLDRDPSDEPQIVECWV